MKTWLVIFLVFLLLLVLYKMNDTVFSSNNLVIISMKLVDNETSVKRINNLRKHINKYDLPIIVIDKYKSKIDNIDMKNRYSNENVLDLINTFKETQYEYAIITEDDFEPIPNFLNELNKTVNLLPTNWRCLHLCPGYLWGRKFRDKSKIGKLNAEMSIDDLEYHKSKRYFIPDNNIWNKKHIWLGGPTCVLVNKSTINNLLNEYTEYNNQHMNDACDVIFTRILNENDYVAMSPQLGYENEQGHSIFDDFLFK